MAQITVAPSVEAYPQVSAFIEEELTRAGCPKALLLRLLTAAEEIFINIASYSGASFARISLTVADDRIALAFVDDGVPYDPLAKEDADTTLTAEQREIGGLGILMVKKLMDEVAYRFEGEKNVLSMTKKWDKEAS